MRTRDFRGLPSAAVINTISINSEHADWKTICEYLKGTVTFLSMRWEVKDDYLIDESISVAYEKAWSYRASYSSEKGKLTTWLNRVAMNSLLSVLENNSKGAPHFDVDRCWSLAASDDQDNELYCREILGKLKWYVSQGNSERAVVARMILDGSDNDEIGRALGKNKNATAVIKSRVKADMSEYLLSQGYDINELIA